MSREEPRGALSRSALPRRKGIIAFIILGLLAGALAKAIMPGDDPGGYIVTAIIGIVGALLGGFVAAALFDAYPLDEFFDISTWLTAVVGAIVLLVIYRLVVEPRAHPRGRPFQLRPTNPAGGFGPGLARVVVRSVSVDSAG